LFFLAGLRRHFFCSGLFEVMIAENNSDWSRWLLFFSKQCEDWCMNQNQNSNNLNPDQFIQIMRTVSLMLSLSIVMFGIVLFVIFKPAFDTQLFAENMKNFFHLFLFLLGFVILLVRVPIANTILSRALEKNKPEDLKGALPSYFSSLILRLALAESAALMGYISSPLSKEATPFAVLAIAALISMVKEIPTKEKILERIKALRPNIQISQ
jgi:hypothetical protein